MRTIFHTVAPMAVGADRFSSGVHVPGGAAWVGHPQGGLMTW
jgi:hypothetical protein